MNQKQSICESKSTQQDSSHCLVPMNFAAVSRNRRPSLAEDGYDEDDGDGETLSTDATRKTKDLKGILTSLMLLDQQEKQVEESRRRASRQENSEFETNHRKRAKSMADYYSDLQSSITEGEETEQRSRTRKSRASRASSISTVTEMDSECTDNKGVGSGSGSGSGPGRRLWVIDRDRAWWEECSRPDYPDEEFKRAFRMSKATFDLICDELNSAVAKEDTTLRSAIPVRQRVAVCIWRLATGQPLRVVSRKFGLGISTCHKLVLEVCAAIKNVLMPKYLQWPDEDSICRVRDEFESLSGIKNVVGSMYTTHIPIIAPKVSVAAYFNKRHTERMQKTSYSITIQAVVNPRGVFSDVCIGWPGSMPDDQVLEKSLLYQRASNGGLMKGAWVVGGPGHPLLDWVLVPYTQQNLTWAQHAFNEKIQEVHNVAREAFGRLKGRWACLQRRTEVKLQDLPTVLGACCVLHNVCELQEEKMDPKLRVEVVDDEVAPEIPVRSPAAAKARDTIAHNLLHHGLAGTSFL